MKFRLIKTGSSNPFFNMAVDQTLLDFYLKEKSLPVIRFYYWQPPTLSLGYFQRVSSDRINLGFIKKKKLGLVRRPTGGRAVFHHKEVTYSVIGGREPIFRNRTVIQRYRIISDIICAGLEELGLNVNVEDKREKSAVENLSYFCFDKTCIHEIRIDRYKVVGSAQCDRNGSFLQHGSIVLNINREFIAGIFNIKSDKVLNSFKGINEITEYELSYKDIEKAMIKSFVKLHKIEIQEDPLTDEETENVERLISEKYSRNSWNLRFK